MTQPAPPSAKTTAQTALAVSPQAVIDSRDVFQGRAVVTIVHGGQAYRLRQTRQGKLILTK